MKHVLTARRGEGDTQELAGLLVEAKPGDEIVVESLELWRLVKDQVGQGDCSAITVTVDKALVEQMRAEARGAAADSVSSRLVGAGRHSPHRVDTERLARRFGTPGATPGSRTFEQAPPPEQIHHPATSDEVALPEE